MPSPFSPLKLYKFLSSNILESTGKKLDALTTKLLNVLGHNIPIYDSVSKKNIKSNDFEEFYMKFYEIVEGLKGDFEEVYNGLEKVHDGVSKDWIIDRSIRHYIENGGTK